MSNELQQNLKDVKPIGFYVSQTSQYLKFGAISAIKQLDIDEPLTLDQYEVLWILLNHDGLYQRQLGQILLKDRPNTTRLVNILCEKGLVERREDADNKRKHMVYITNAGKDKVNDLAPLKEGLVNKVLKGITKEELDVTLATLEKIRFNLKDEFTMQI